MALLFNFVAVPIEVNSRLRALGFQPATLLCPPGFTRNSPNSVADKPGILALCTGRPECVQIIKCLDESADSMPLQLLLIVPFMRFGELILRADSVNVIPKHFSDLFRPGEALKGLGHAVLGWLIICAVLSWPVAYGLTPLFAFLRRKYALHLSRSSTSCALFCQLGNAHLTAALNAHAAPSASLLKARLLVLACRLIREYYNDKSKRSYWQRSSD